MKKAIFTIVSNNYFSRALTLVDSLKSSNNQLDIFIVLADQKSSVIDYLSPDYKMIYLQDVLAPVLLEEMEFKYDIVEFNTSIKPFIFRNLFQQGYEKVIYFDPDIYVYSDLSELLDIMDNYSVVLTPHRTCANMAQGKDCFNEVEISAAGVFNLGFCAISNTTVGNTVVDWWCNKLQDYSYVDYKFGLFYDQKWMNFIPCYFPEDVKILLDPGYNYAPWNFDERTVDLINDKLMIYDLNNRKSKLYFIHYSGFDPLNENYIIQKHLIDISLPESMRRLCREYAQRLIKNGYKDYSSIPYAFNFYDNGDKVSLLHRQLYRKLLENGKSFNNLFSTDKKSFYHILLKSKLLNNGEDVTKKKNVRDFDKKASKVNKLLKCAKKILGIKKYTMLMRYLAYASRLDNQTFLLSMKMSDKI